MDNDKIAFGIIVWGEVYECVDAENTDTLCTDCDYNKLCNHKDRDWLKCWERDKHFKLVKKLKIEDGYATKESD